MRPGLLLLSLPPSLAFEVTLLLSREVRGALSPLDASNARCLPNASSPTNCRCFGGVARRRTLFEQAGGLLIDTGNHFSGSGNFFSVFGGNASAAFMAAAKYHAFALGYRDFTAGVSAADPTGGALLAGYISQVRSLNPDSPAAVVSNLNLTGDPYLTEATPTRDNPRAAGHVAPYTLLTLPGGRTLAILALLDPTHLVVRRGIDSNPV